jgi:hypothetical protein
MFGYVFIAHHKSLFLIIYSLINSLGVMKLVDLEEIERIPSFISITSLVS